jgi:Holliday junction resolvase RusA-like endonuclease
MTIQFDIPGIAFPQPRPRITIRNGHAWAYESERVRPWKQAVEISTRINLTKSVFYSEVPVYLKLAFWLPRPKSLPKKIDRHVKRPDLDNVIKSTVDAMTRAGAWKDDSQIYKLTAEKLYAPEGGECCTVIIEYKDANEIGGIEIEKGVK